MIKILKVANIQREIFFFSHTKKSAELYYGEKKYVEETISEYHEQFSEELTSNP